jgi:dynein heavy chain, axonemal
MIVGPSYKVLAESMIHIKQSNREPNDMRYQFVKYYILNPKAINMGELYGEVDPFTNEWQDGLASDIIRGCNTKQVDDPAWDPNMKHWIIFDGPVDALWIENMNSVLDDSMTLCLANSERIKLRSELRMLFEVQDLAVASPATVSRCGMVYMTPEQLGWEPYMRSWMKRTFTLSPEEHSER